METTTTSTGGGHNGLKVLVIVGGVVLLIGAGAYLYAKKKKGGATGGGAAGGGAAGGGAAGGDAAGGVAAPPAISQTVANAWKGELGQNGGQIGLDTQSALKDAWIKLYQSNVKGTKDAEIKDAWKGHDSHWWLLYPDRRKERDRLIASIEQKYSMIPKDSPLFPYSGSRVWDLMGDFIFNIAKKNPNAADLVAFEKMMNTIGSTNDAWFTKVAMSKVPYLRLYVPYV